MVLETESQMKRVVLLILALFLLLDLAEDGCLGKAAFVPPQSSAGTTIKASKHDCPQKVDTHWTQTSHEGDSYCQLQCMTVTLPSHSSLNRSIHKRFGSSGGIPLVKTIAFRRAFLWAFELWLPRYS